MIAAVWVASLVKRFFLYSERMPLLKSVGIVALTSFFVMWASGYFMIGSNFNPEGWNYVFRWQPLSLVDSGTEGSTGWSHLLGDRAQLDGETEAFSFLGAGVIVLMAVSLARAALQNRMTKVLVAIGVLAASTLLFVSIARSLPLSRVVSISAFLVIVAFLCVVMLNLSRLSRFWRSYVPLIIAACMLAVYSMTNRVGFAQQTLFEYPLFPPLRQFTETFRTHGRSIWPLFYLVQLAAVITFTKSIPKKLLTTILCALLCLQIYDSSSAISSARKRFTNAPRWSSPLTDPIWESSVQKYKYLVVIPPLNNDPEGNWIAIADFASKHKLATNSGYFSRFDQNTYELITDGYLEQIKRNQFNRETVYIIDQKLIPNSLHSDLKINDELEEPNGYWVVFP
jgi:hypothetical protein